MTCPNCYALEAGEATDTIRKSLAPILQELIEAEATAVIGAAPRADRDPDHAAHRSPGRLLSTAAGDVELSIPQLREGSGFVLVSGAVDVGSGRIRRCTEDRHCGGRDSASWP